MAQTFATRSVATVIVSINIMAKPVMNVLMDSTNILNANLVSVLQKTLSMNQMFVIRSMVIAMKFVISPRPKGINVRPAKVVTTKVVMNVNLATAIPMDDQAFHALQVYWQM